MEQMDPSRGKETPPMRKPDAGQVLGSMPAHQAGDAPAPGSKGVGRRLPILHAA